MILTNCLRSIQSVPLLVYETTTLVLVIRLFIQYQRNRTTWTSPLLKVLLEDMLIYLAVYVPVLVISSQTSILFTQNLRNIHLQRSVVPKLGCKQLVTHQVRVSSQQHTI